MNDSVLRVDLRTDHLALIGEILRKHIPDREVVVFGSRATRTTKEYSDLDLAVLGDEPLTVDIRSALAEDLGESDLPFKVDLVDWARIDEPFRDIIRRDGVPLNDLEERKIAKLRHRALQRLNFASAQNDVAIIEEIAVENPTNEALTDIRITLRATPPIIRDKTWTIDRVAPRSHLSVRDVSTPLDIARLEGLDEAEVGELEFRMEAQGHQTIVEKCRIELLARDEWGGVGDMAQILAAFVSPNDPPVARVLKDAARLLEAGGYDGSMDGYQSADPRRAYLLAGAIWSAITGLALTYAEPPASFEREGQKIRGPSRIIAEGLTTCLDSTLFLAAAFEAAGLNPVVLFSQGHAWVGVWVLKKDFGYVTEPDVVAVRKAVQAHEFIPIETTLLTKRPSIGFDNAVDEGRRRLSESRDPEFVMAVDIARSRAARIRPLASHRTADKSEDDAVDDAIPAALPSLPDFGLLPSEINEEEPETPLGRIERWQRKLLDLSLRNRLLNYRNSKQTLTLRCLSVADLEDELASGKKFQGFSLSDNDPFGSRTVSPEEAQRIEEDVIRDAFERGQVVVPLSGQEMSSRLLTLYRRARSDMQEGGTNTLFLAAGFLRWKKSEGDLRTYRAPLILIPVSLERRSAQSPFRIAHHEDDVQINSTLLEFLKRDFDLRIPELEGELPRDDSGIDVPLIFDIIRRKVRDVVGFEVVEELALSNFSFAKYLMWKDLVDRTDQLRHNRLVKHLIDGPEETYGNIDDKPLIAPKEIDRHHLRDLLIPLPADSSQLSAVLAASEGRDFILVGPPGTGKSQTITNIIAQCMGEGKTVLFVAEKGAALDVVHRRLVATGLGDAVLEIHSNKTDRKSVLSQLGRSWDRASEGTEEKWIEITEELMVYRDRLNDYVEALHAKGSQGFSVFDAISLIAPDAPPFEISFPSKDAHDEESYKQLVNLAADLGRTYAAVENGPPLLLIRSEEWSFLWESEILVAIETLQKALDELKRAEHSLAREFGLRSDPKLEAGRRERLKGLAPRLEPGALDLSSVPDLSADRLTDHAETLATDLREFARANSETVAAYSLDTIRRMPFEQLDQSWREAQTKFWPVSAFAKRKVRKLLQTYAENGAADPAVDLKALFKVRERDTSISENPLALSTETAGRTDADRSTEAVRQAVEFRAVLANLDSNVEDSVRFESATSSLASKSGGAALDAVRAYIAAEEMADEKIGEFIRKDGVFPIGMSVADFDTELSTVIAQRARLGDWAKWVKKSEEGRARGLGPLIEMLESGGIKGNAAEAFKRSYAAWWLPLAMDASNELRGFAHWDHEDTITAFRKLVDGVAELAPVEVMRRIAHGLPAKDGVPKQSELGILRHQLGLVRPSMPIRQLLARLPQTFGKLAPCVLMSPLSVAQYLPADQATFDVVIFDEASQITTWDAIGTIARGLQTIVVGDPKQLPPTNFFGRADDEDEDLPEVERDMPSILDEVSSAGIPHRYLNWHYRSRNEALIAFSNHFYYDNQLVTFPAPSTGSSAIQLHEVNGTYARGRGRVNQEEAKAVAEMVRRRLKTWLMVPEDERQTLGWKILRIWSTDWFRNPSSVENRIQLDLDEILEKDRQVRATTTNLADASLMEIESHYKSGNDPDGNWVVPFHAENDEVAKDRTAMVFGEEKPLSRIENFSIPVTATPASQIKSNADSVDQLSVGHIGSTEQQDITPDPDRFFDEQYAPTLRHLIRHIVDREGPIPIHRLVRRVAQEHGWQRAGRRIQAQVQSNLSLVECHLEFKINFIWAPGSHSDRVPFRGLNRRPIRDVSRAEIGSVIDAHARALANEGDPILALSRHLGISRLSKDARAYLSVCAEWSKESGVPMLPAEE